MSEFDQPLLPRIKLIKKLYLSGCWASEDNMSIFSKKYKFVFKYQNFLGKLFK